MKTSLKYILATGLMAISVNADAIPAYPGKIKHIQPDGSTVEYTLKGDERCHALYSEGKRVRIDHGMFTPITGEAYTDIKDFGDYYRKHAAPQRVYDDTAFPTTGDMRGLVLLVNFTDAKIDEAHPMQLFEDMMNLEGYPYNGATGSVRDYFIDQSRGEFRPTFDVYGPIELPSTPVPSRGMT